MRFFAVHAYGRGLEVGVARTLVNESARMH